MKMFLLGMLVMYLGTTIITTIASIWIDADDFLEIVFFFPLVMIAKIIKPIKNFVIFPKVCIFLLSRGINPCNSNYSRIIEMTEENQQKFIKVHPKKYQKKLKKYLTILRSSVLINIEREVQSLPTFLYWTACFRSGPKLPLYHIYPTFVKNFYRKILPNIIP